MIVSRFPHSTEMDEVLGEEEEQEGHHSPRSEDMLPNGSPVSAVEDDEEGIITTPSAKVFKEGFLEKKGHSSAFFMWPKWVLQEVEEEEEKERDDDDDDDDDEEEEEEEERDEGKSKVEVGKDEVGGGGGGSG